MPRQASLGIPLCIRRGRSFYCFSVAPFTTGSEQRELNRDTESLACTTIAIGRVVPAWLRSISRLRMRSSVSLWLVLSPLFAMGDVRWHKFGTSGDKETIVVGHVTVTVELQKVQTSGFPDDLLMTVKIPGHNPSQFYFSSSYGFGSVAVQGSILLLKYGVGRGTAGARVEHVKALRLGHQNLDELADVQCSYWIVTNPHNAGPNEFHYQLEVQTKGDHATLSFVLPKPRYGLPLQKIVRIKNDR